MVIVGRGDWRLRLCIVSRRSVGEAQTSKRVVGCPGGNRVWPAAGVTIEPVPVVIFGVVTGIAAVLVVVAWFRSPRESLV